MTNLRNHIAKKLSQVDLPEVYQLNRFLNVQLIHKHEIEGFISFIDRSLNLDLSFNKPNVPFGIYFTKGENDKNTAFVYFETTKTIPSFFTFSLPDTEFVEFKNFRSFIKTYNNFQFDKKVSIEKIRNSKLKALVYNVDLPFQANEIINIDLFQKQDVTEDLIDSFFPDIVSIPLLTNEFQVSSTAFNYSFDKPNCGIVKEKLTINQPEKIISIKLSVIKSSDNFEIEIPKTELIEISEILFPSLPDENKQLSQNLIENSETNIEDKILCQCLEPVYELTDKIKAEVLKGVPEFQKVGAEVLFQNDFVFFNDEFEIGRELQAIAALRMLLRIRKIKKVLILTNESNNMICRNTPLISQCGLWQMNLDTLLHEYEYKFHNDISISGKENIFKNHIINLVEYETFEEAFVKGIFNHEELNLFDTIIFDDFNSNVLSLNCMSLFEENSFKNKLWFLSNSNEEKLTEEISNLFPERNLEKFGRQSDEIESLKNMVFNYDFYLQINDEQFEEVNELISNGRETIDDLFGIGNYLRVQPNAFHILQDAQRQTNFVEEIKCSNKVSLLINHLSSFLIRENRILIYSQFDEGGLQEIEYILQLNNVRYIKFNYSDNSETIIKNLEICKSSDEPMVYLTNLKPTNINFKFPRVNHIINFDNWWNPLTRWVLEEKIQNSKPIKVFNYYSNDLEKKLISDLTLKGMFERNVIKVLKPEKLYSMFDETYWAEFFDIDYEYDKTETDYTEGIFNILQLVEFAKLLLTKLGYEKVKSSATELDETYKLIAETADKREIEIIVSYAEFINSNKINSFLKTRNKPVPFLIITNGSISHSKVILPPDVSLINGKSLSRYLELL